MMICLNQNLHQNQLIHSVLIGKLLIKNHQQKTMDQVIQTVLHIQIMAIQMLTVVDTGKHEILMKYLN